MTDDFDPFNAPIHEHDYLGSATVVDYGEARVARGKSYRPPKMCAHRSMVYDQNERRVWCKDCENTLDGFEAFLVLVEHHEAAWEKIERMHEEAREAKEANITRRAAKKMDEAWRMKGMVPTCPHCWAGLLPEDVASGVNAINEKLVRKARQRGDGE